VPHATRRRIRSLVALLVLASAGGLFAASPPARGQEEPANSGLAGEDFVFGVVPQAPIDAADTRMMRAGGLDSFRFWLGWWDVESYEDAFDWERADAVVAAASAEGLAPFPYLFGSPLWATEHDRAACEGVECIPFAPRTERTRTEFAEFAGSAARRYGPGGTFWEQHPSLPYRPIRAWQIWNEQNLPAFFSPEVDAGLYAELLAASAEAIREVDPGAEIVLGGMWGPPDAGGRVVPTQRFLRALYARGAGPSFDTIGVHPYAPRLRDVFGQIRGVRRVARENGDREARLVISEIGWASGGPKRQNLVKNQAAQARLLRKAYGRFTRRSERWKLWGAYWYAWRDTTRAARVCGWCAQAGLHSVRGRAKPAWRVLRALARD